MWPVRCRSGFDPWPRLRLGASRRRARQKFKGGGRAQNRLEKIDALRFRRSFEPRETSGKTKKPEPLRGVMQNRCIVLDFHAGGDGVSKLRQNFRQKFSEGGACLCLDAQSVYGERG